MRSFISAAAVLAFNIVAPFYAQDHTTRTVQVTFDDWTVPTPNSFPHDPAFGQGNTLWYTGQASNKLGRVDMTSGQFREYDLPQGHGPNGVVPDRDGNIWYTANAAAAIGKLDPKSGYVTEFKMPDPVARDPHTPIFAQDGTLWFTVQGGSFVGRLDPKTMQITEYPLPNPQARPRRIAIDADDIVWYTDYRRGYLGRLDSQTKQVKEYASPGGTGSQPYGITTTPDGAVWYSESGIEPNTLVRFDPRTETFQKWNIPSGGGVVRHMVTAPSGELLLAYSGVNKIGRVRLR